MKCVVKYQCGCEYASENGAIVSVKCPTHGVGYLMDSVRWDGEKEDRRMNEDKTKKRTNHGEVYTCPNCGLPEDDCTCGNPHCLVCHKPLSQRFCRCSGTRAIYDKPITGIRVGKCKAQRGSVLDDAKKTINGERQDSYGNPEDSFALIAEFWNTYLQTKLTVFSGDPEACVNLGIGREDVARMMALFKIARMLGQKDSRDNYVDGCGYLALAADMREGAE